MKYKIHYYKKPNHTAYSALNVWRVETIEARCEDEAIQRLKRKHQVVRIERIFPISAYGISFLEKEIKRLEEQVSLVDEKEEMKLFDQIRIHEHWIGLVQEEMEKEKGIV